MQRARALAVTPATQLTGLAEYGRLCHANLHAAEAEACWRLLAAAEPRNARWPYYLADLSGWASDAPGMLAQLRRTVDLAPDYAPAWLRLGDLEFKTDHIDAAQQAYRRRLALLPDDPYASLGLARVTLQEGERSRARKQIERLILVAPAFAPAHNLYAEILSADGDTAGAARERLRGTECGRFREAEDPWLDELMRWCFDYDRLCVRGSVDALTKHGDRGQAYFTRAISIRPDELAAYELLGNLYVDLNEPAKARDTYENGLRRQKGSRLTPEVFVNLSRAERMLQQPAEAARVALDGLERAGETAELYRALGNALSELEQNAAAVEALRKAVALNGRDARTNYDLAVALINVRRLDEAMEILRRSLAYDAGFPATLALLAKIEIDSGRWRDAEQYLRPLYEAHPELPEAKARMAGYYLQCGIEAEANKDLAQAEQSYRRGLAVDESVAALQARLGVLCLIQHRFADSITPLEAYYRLEPDNPQATLFLGEAYAVTGRQTEARRLLTDSMQRAQRAGQATTEQHARNLLQHVLPPTESGPVSR